MSKDNLNEDCINYIEKYADKCNITFEEALSHKIIQNIIQFYSSERKVLVNAKV